MVSVQPGVMRAVGRRPFPGLERRRVVRGLGKGSGAYPGGFPKKKNRPQNRMLRRRFHCVLGGDGGDGGESLSQKDLSTTKRVGYRCITAIFGAKATAIEILVPIFTRFV